MSDIPSAEDKVTIGPLLDRRSGEDRRKGNDQDFFKQGGIKRRCAIEYRQKGERYGKKADSIRRIAS